MIRDRIEKRKRAKDKSTISDQQISSMPKNIQEKHLRGMKYQNNWWFSVLPVAILACT